MPLWVHLLKSLLTSIKVLEYIYLCSKIQGFVFTTHVLSPSFPTVLIPFCYENSLLSLRKRQPQLAKSLRHPAERTARLEPCSVFLIDPFVSSSLCPFVLQLKHYINKVWSDFFNIKFGNIRFGFNFSILMWYNLSWCLWADTSATNGKMKHSTKQAGRRVKEGDTAPPPASFQQSEKTVGRVVQNEL